MREELARFDPRVPIERASTPPASWYRDPAFHELERRTLFRRTWQAVGRCDQLETPGDFFTGEVAGEPYVVLRDTRGELRAFFNVCRHHAACVATGEGRAETLVCPYHGWEYDLDGRLRRAPRMAGVECFDREALGLEPIEVAAWGPLIFLRLEPSGPALDELLRPLDSRLDCAGLRFVARRSWELACNWKVFVDNYLDGGYHVDVLHRDLAGQLDLQSYRTEIEGQLSLQVCEAGAGEAGGGVDFAERVGGGAVYAWVHPNFMINRYGPIMDTNLALPLGPDRTLTVFDYYFDAERAGDDEFVARSLAASEQVQQEDIDICESVQRGLASSAYDRGRYAPRVEQAAYHFHGLLAESLSEPACDT